MINVLRRKFSGFALALALFLIVILSIVCFAALNITTLDSRTATEDYKASRAFYAARAGIAFAKSQLTDSAHVSLTEVLHYSKRNLQLADGGSAEEAFSLVITPAADNASRVFRIWKIESTGYYDNATRKVIAYLERETFARYAYFSDGEVRNGTELYFTGMEQITGAVHTNSYFNFSGHPKFSSQVVSANYDDNRYNASNGTYKRTDNVYVTDNKDFYRSKLNNYTLDRPEALNDSPDFSFSGGQRQIPLPSTTSQELIAAANSAQTSLSGTNKGDYRIVFTEDGKAKFYKKKSDGTFSGFPSRANNYRDTPTKTIDTTTIPGTTMYVEGNIYISGKVKGRCTLSSSQTTYIVDDLTYANENNCVLGILSEDNIVIRTDINTNRDIYIDAILMSLNGSFTVENYNSGKPRGDIHLFGGVVQKVRGPVGTFYANSDGSATPATGYNKDYMYDPKLETMPPLHFPNTGKFTIRYFIDKGSLGGV